MGNAGVIRVLGGWRAAPRWCRSAAYGSVLVAAMLCCTVAGICYRIYRSNSTEGVGGLAPHPRPTASSRILVFAPHPDDETLACGGLLYTAVHAGAAVRVVFVTSGDGFGLAVRRSYPRALHLAAADFIRFGKRRQEEALSAAARLGVPQSDVLFLGYPDRGTAHMWLEHWDEARPYTSPYIRVCDSPYPRAYHKGAPFAGRSLLDDLTAIIRDFRPTDVYLPHPNDEHPDHWATSCFVRAALQRVDSAGTVRAYTYLVHRGDWPVPQGLHPEAKLAPPAALAHLDTTWSVLPLSPAAEAAKETALLAHRSQVRMMSRFLKSFVRRDEVFGTIPAATVPPPPPGGVHLDADASEWRTVPAAVREPVADSLPVEMQGSGDLASIRVCQDDRRLYVLLTSRRKMSRGFSYVVYLHTLDDKARVITVAGSPGKRMASPGIPVAARGDCMEMAIPLARLGGARTVFLGAVARRPEFVIDTTGWRVIHLAPSPKPNSLRVVEGASGKRGSGSAGQ